MFNKFNKELKKKKLLVSEGVIVDASIIENERPNNTKDKQGFIKELKKGPEEWSEGKKRQKDMDARWTKKRKRNYFGYKNHIKVDKDKRLSSPARLLQRIHTLVWLIEIFAKLKILK